MSCDGMMSGDRGDEISKTLLPNPHLNLHIQYAVSGACFGVIFIKAKKHINENIRKNLEVIVDEICS